MTAPAPAQAGVSGGRLVRTLVPLGFVVTLVGLVTSFVAPFLPLFLSRDLHASPALASLFLFLMPLAAVAVATVVGRLSDRPALRARLLLLAAASGVAGFALFSFARNYWVSLALAVTVLAVAASLTPQTFAFSRLRLDQTHPERAASGISYLRSLLSLAWVAGPPLAALLIETVTFTGLYLVAAAMYLAVLPVLLGFRTAAGAAAQPGPAPGDAADSDSLPPRRILLGTSAAFTLLQCAGTLGVMSMPLFVGELGEDVGDAGLVLGLCAALEIPLMLLFGALAARHSVRRLVLLGAGLGVAYFAVVAASTHLWQVAAAQLLNASFIAAATGLGMSYFQDLMPTRLGRATTMFSNSYRISAMLAGLVFGAVQVAGYRSSYLLGVGLCVVGLVVLALIRPQQPDGVAALDRVGLADVS
jgi:SET family sugar efflux transporter-like MFS transporter